MSNILNYTLTFSGTAFSASVSHGSKTDVTYSSIAMTLSLCGISFQRKLYEPGHIQAELLISTSEGTLIPVGKLTSMFIGNTVSLAVSKDGAASTVASNYYVHEISPQFETRDNYSFVYVKLDIFSKDKVLTLNKFSKAYLGQKLISGIVSPFVADARIGVSLRALTDSSLQKLGYLDGTTQVELIQPYLIQYNESFHDFLKRVANRCGEAFYFEGGQLCFGLKAGGTSTPVNDASRIIFQRVSGAPFSVGDYARDTVKELRSNNTYKPGGDSIITDSIPYDVDFPGDAFPKETAITDTKISEAYNSEVSSEDSYMLLYKNKFARDNYWDLLWGDTSEHFVGWLSEILNSNSLLEALTKHGSKMVSALIKSGVKCGEANKKGNEKLKNASLNNSDDDEYAVLFSKVDDTLAHWVTLDYYQGIRAKEEDLGRKTVCIDMGEGFRDLKLGDKITIPGDSGTTYVVIRIDMSSGNEWMRSYEGISGLQAPAGGRQSQLIYAIPMDGTVFFPPLLPGKPFRRSGPQPAFIADAGDPMQQGRVRIRFPWQPSYGVKAKEDDAADKKVAMEAFYKKDNDGKIVYKDGEPVFADGIDMGKYNDAVTAYNKSLDAITDAKRELKKDASPWIRMATPMATPGGGMYFCPEVGDEVMVDFENGNVDRPYVVGTLYSKNVTAPTDGSRVIKSPNGHTIKLSDPTDLSDFLAGAYPGLKYLKGLGVDIDTATLNGDARKILGGIELTDKYGFYNIKMSSHDRSISISSQFGDISINALTGISIEAPNGDISISGKNIDISANNKITITSGKNIKNNGGRLGYLKPFSDPSAAGKAVGKMAANILGGKFFDLSLIRTLLEIFMRPIDGTLQITSGRFMQLEAGGAKAVADVGEYETHFSDRFDDASKSLALVHLMSWFKDQLTSYSSSYGLKLQVVRSALPPLQTAHAFGAGAADIIKTPGSLVDLVKTMFNEPLIREEKEFDDKFQAFISNTQKIDFNPGHDNFLGIWKGYVKELLHAVNGLRLHVEQYEHLLDAPDDRFGKKSMVKFFIKNCTGFATDAKTILKLVNTDYTAVAAPAAAPPPVPVPPPTPTVAQIPQGEAGLYGKGIKKIEDYAQNGQLADFNALPQAEIDNWVVNVQRRLMCLAIEKSRDAASNPFKDYGFMVAPAVYAPTFDATGAVTYHQPACLTFPFDPADWKKYVADIHFMEVDVIESAGSKFLSGLKDGALSVYGKIDFLPEALEGGVWKATSKGAILISDQKNETYQFKGGGVERHQNMNRVLVADEDLVRAALDK